MGKVLTKDKDPTKPENWSTTDTSKNIRLKFKDTPDYKYYMKELKNITKKITSENFLKKLNIF